MGSPAEVALVVIAGVSLLATGIGWSVSILRQRPRERLAALEREVAALRKDLQEVKTELQSRL